jgi:hypothetical protein
MNLKYCKITDIVIIKVLNSIINDRFGTSGQDSRSWATP